MTVTPQTNSSLPEIASVLAGAQTIAICGHINPDGDCLGSQLALAHLLRSQGKEVSCLLARDDSIGLELHFLPGIEEIIPAASFEGTPDVFVAVDVPSPERLGDAAAVQKRSPITITIDHHAYDPAMSQYNYVDPDAASTTMLIWDLITCMVPVEQIPSESAICAYAGLLTDTGGFRFQNTDARAFKSAFSMISCGIEPSRVATHVFQTRRYESFRLEERLLAHLRFECGGTLALSFLTQEDFAQVGASKADSEPLIDVLRSIAGVRVACLLREEAESIRGSLRAKDDTDVARIARLFDGGGHKAAAGFTIYHNLDTAIDQVITEVSAVLAADDPTCAQGVQDQEPAPEGSA